ncbi:class F sortase [Streptomyces sp. NPDC006296]|uniref:class F sortase n=1 Tax=Streptomyces sp. NPDC006296 TaxID=3156746 RepID=UPI0033BE1164
MHRWDSGRPVAPDWAAGPREPQDKERRSIPWELGLLAAALVLVALQSLGGPGGPPQPEHAGTALSSEYGAGAEHVAAAPMPASPPLRVRIPAIDVDAPVMDLAIEDSGRLASPPEGDPDLAGWWARGPAPGTRGTAVMAGHVDIPTGPAVFYDLGALKLGMSVRVLRADGSTAHFTIDSIDVYSAADFPDHKVYADTGRPEIRLITCGGGFDRKRQRYEGNVVVSAYLTTS